ncbi:ABC transporter permease [Salipaludibacillus daqingensis]|uniref:ABC transporter permease n=1 Tax=Salipaludibacillus daqingensis TaxID=3041001 RepID=UPI002475F335|nr:ABC transporter permease subunit [Salipaludibacillus daqingensis]
MRSQWIILFKKEFRESIRNFKWLWIPTVFVLLGLMQPITSYYIADILEQFGGLPEGTVMELPPPSGAEVLTGTLGQFSQIGFLVLVLAFMGTVVTEKNQGTLIMVLVKPVSYVNYLTAKWVHLLILSLTSFVLGFVMSVYYTFLLIDTIPISQVVNGALVYALWITFVMTIVLCLSALLNSTAFVAFATLGTAILFSIFSLYAPDLMKGTPGMLATYSQQFFYLGEVESGFWISIFVTLGLILAMMIATIFLFNKKEFAKDVQ